DIESCFFPIPWRDALEILESDAFSFYSYGLEIPGDPSGNLCVKAYELLKTDFHLPPVTIHLVKGIPMGAGLGGGSSDGAFTLKTLNELFELNLEQAQLADYALQLGSDCPFFIYNEPMMARGRGEKLSPLEFNLKGYHVALYNPEIHISTKEAYSGIVPSEPKQTIENVIRQPFTHWKDTLANDFEASIFPNHPAIEKIKESMYEAGAQYASMTGSGSTVYGIFKNPVDQPEWKWLPFQ
ncbi:MAG: 4-(cytidine 5'-diphospho)-2-C-methyl-D-erythritol kinase, partial [Bacteroidota bacterium]